MKNKVNYAAIYEVLENRKGKVITPSGLAHAIGVDRIYGATMTKLVRDGYIVACVEKGFYKVC